MQQPKKRKRETVEAGYFRITYSAPGRTFDRLFNESSLEEMKDVVRKKLGVATSTPVYLSQVRDGTSVDLEDDDDFDAFYYFAHASWAAHVNVVVGSDTPTTQALPNGDSEFTTSSAKKKKKKSKATSVASSSALVDSPPHKKRRVSFVENQPEQSVVPATPEKKRHKPVADYSPPPEPGNEESPAKSTEKKKKKKKTPATEELAVAHTENVAETIPETPSPKKTRKRTREEDTSQVPSSAQPKRTDSLVDTEDEAPRHAKKSKKKLKETDDEPTSQKSRSKSVPPTSTRKTSTVDPSPSVEPEPLIKSKKKGKERGVSEPPSADAPGSPEQIRYEEASKEKKKKGKSKEKADQSLSVDPSTSTKLKAAEVKKNKDKLAQQEELPQSDSAISTKKKGKATEIPQAITPKVTTSRKDLDEPTSAPVEVKRPGRGRKTQDAETSRSSKSGTSQGTSQDPVNSREQKSEQIRAATLAAIQAVLERKGITTYVPPQAPQPAAPQPALQVATSEGEEELPDLEEDNCPLCDESPTHDRPLCPVVKGGVRAMRKRVGQLEKDTSGDETKQQKRQQVIVELQVMIQKRARGPRTSNAATNSAIAVKKAVTQNKDPQPATPAPITEATKTAKQVDVVSPSTREVDVVPSIASSQPVKSTPSITKSLKPTKQPSSLQPPPASQPSSSQKSLAKTAQDKVTTDKLIAKLPLVTEPSLDNLGDLPLDLSQVTDNYVQHLVHGRRMSITDLLSSGEDEDEDEQDEEELLLDEDEPQETPPRRLSQSSALLEYPSASDAEEEDDSAQGRVSKVKSTSLSEGEDSTDDERNSEGPLLRGEGDTSFRELDNRGSSREIDQTGDDAFDAALDKDFAPLNGVLPINGKRKGAEVDSDTAVGSQVEEIVDPRAKEKKVESTTTTTDPIETSKEPSDEPDLIVSDDDHPPAQSTPKVESIIRTRSQRKKDADQQEDSAVQSPKTVKKARKITELPVPSLPTSVRVIKSPNPSTNGKGRSKAPVKDTKRSANTKSKGATSETSKGKASTKAGSQVSAVNGAVSKPKSLYKITPMERMDLVEALNRASGSGNDIIGSQWAVLQEGNPLTETPGQVDELHSDFTTQVDQTPLMVKQSQDREPLFLPSATQQSFSYSQFSEIFTTPGGEDVHEPSHESDDENEVLATVVKPVQPVRTYRGLSQIASSQTFVAPKFQPPKFGEMKDPESLYGRNRHDVLSETDSSSESDEDRSVMSHIPASRRAGLPPKK